MKFFFFSIRTSLAETTHKSGRLFLRNSLDMWQNLKKSILKKSKVWGLTGGPTESVGGWRFFQIFFMPCSDDGENLNKSLSPIFPQTLVKHEKRHFLPHFPPFPPFKPRIVYSRVDRKWFRAHRTLGRNIFPLSIWEGKNTPLGSQEP